MYTFLLMVVDFIQNGHLHWYMLFILFILLRWMIVKVFAVQYKPYNCENKNLFTSVIIPVVDESIDIFTKVLNRILEQAPGEIIIVINGPYNSELI